MQRRGGWGLVAPRADLYDDKGKHRGTHTGGPTWQDQDGSTVVASRVDGVTVDPTAIPWLLLKATPTAPGKLGKTTYIQRIATEGGLAPAASSCTAGGAGEIVECRTRRTTSSGRPGDRSAAPDGEEPRPERGLRSCRLVSGSHYRRSMLSERQTGLT